MWGVIIIICCHCCSPCLLVNMGKDEGGHPPPHLCWLLIWVRARDIVMLVMLLLSCQGSEDKVSEQI